MKNFAVINHTAKIIKEHFSASGKAFYLDYASRQEPHIWIPKSICQFSEVNDCGNLQILIPMWFISKNCWDYHRIENFSEVQYK